MDREVKRHNILIEPWRGESGPNGERGSSCFRWTVSFERGGRFIAQGYGDTHAEARAAAEQYLRDQGVDLNWQPPPGVSAKVLTPRKKRSLR